MEREKKEREIGVWEWSEVFYRRDREKFGVGVTSVRFRMPETKRT